MRPAETEDHSIKQVKESLEGVLAFLTAHPDKARSFDRPATAILDEGLRCPAQGFAGHTLMTDIPQAIGENGTLVQSRCAGQLRDNGDRHAAPGLGVAADGT